MSKFTRKYVVITPVRNEEKFIEITIRSMISQNIRPAEWIIVDDGSSDNTSQIVEKYTLSFPWIKLVKRQDRGFREYYIGVMEAFNDGLAAVNSNDWEFIVKMDGDLQFDGNYFSRCLNFFDSNPKLGIGGGTIYNKHGDRLIKESTPQFHVRGATKIYRRDCWEEINGLESIPGWDTLDVVKANMLGWETRTLSNLPLTHLRITTTAEGFWKSHTYMGFANFYLGYHPAYFLAKSIIRIKKKPYFFGSLALLTGFLSGYAFRKPQYPDRELIRYLRKQQTNRLLGKKTIWM